MKKQTFSILVLAALVVVSITIFSCKKNAQLSTATYSATPNLPSTPYPYWSKNRVDSNVATLGRVLFYDRRLSVNNAVACGSCHLQSRAFADYQQFSTGFDGRKTRRNSIAIQNIVGFFNDFNNTGVPATSNQITSLNLFWDGRQNNLSNMVGNPINNHIEMHMDDMNALCTRLQATSFYPDLFQKAFGSSTVSRENIAFALEAFVQCLQTNNSKFDKSLSFNTMTGQQQIPQPLTAIEQQGLNAFTSTYNCNACHQISQTGYSNSFNEFANIGLDVSYTDNGRGEITGNASDNGSFKVPNLRNIELTAPYMHDGRYNTLEEVIDHYSHNIQPNRYLSATLRDLNGVSIKTIISPINVFTEIDTTGLYQAPPQQKNITDADKKALVAFLKTLTDLDFITNPMYSNPFIKQ